MYEIPWFLSGERKTFEGIASPELGILWKYFSNIRYFYIFYRNVFLLQNFEAMFLWNEKAIQIVAGPCSVESEEQLFAEAPGLGGFFTITMSENLTNCYSRAKGPLTCPRCAARKPWEVVAEVNNLMARGAHASAPNARAIAWSWAWGDEWAAKVPALLTEGQIVQCVSEERLATNVGGVAGVVRDYSISQPGPGQKALTVWSAARESGHETCAKVQINNSWEMPSLKSILPK